MISKEKKRLYGKSALNFKDDLPDEGVFIINNIRFTPREIDMLACLLNARSTKKIASFLSIYPKTVRNHIHNIMIKLGCNSRDSILDFMERSEKLALLKDHYSNLMIKVSFEQSLKEISKMKREAGPPCKLIYWTGTNSSNSFISHLQTHLKFAGINASLELRKDKPTFFELLKLPQTEEYEIYILPQFLVENFEGNPLVKDKVLSCFPQNNSSAHRLFLLLEGSPSLGPYNNKLSHLFLDLSSQENYFLAFFAILNKLFPHPNIDNIVTGFKDKYKAAHIDHKNLTRLTEQKPFLENSFHLSRWLYCAFTCLLLIFIGSGFLVFFRKEKNNEIVSLRSDLIIPLESVFLNRPELINQIDNALKKGEGIQTVALIGIGGSGKTTLARQYARQQKANIIWEMNAETPANLRGCFENLAQDLSKTEEDKKILREVQEIKHAEEREKKFIKFVKEKLKLHSNWLLIYDNVEDFADIQIYFPKDANTWGQGKVIFTTRNHNIQNSRQVNGLVLMGELTPEQQYTLFTQIMQQDKNYKLLRVKDKNLMEFLKQLPPFPLDISAAAYYLKTLNISYEQYLESLKQQGKDFTVVQENLLKEAGEYKKTRYAIITRSLELLLKSHKDFSGLLLFISLIDSQNIPKGLLDKYKNSGIVDNFIYHLKKHSLITTSPSKSSYSIHRSAQAIALSYLTKLLEFNEKNSMLKEIVSTLDDYANRYIEQEDFAKLKLLVSHIKFFLNCDNLLANSTKHSLEGTLGCIYAHVGFAAQAKPLLEKSLAALNKSPHRNYKRICRVLAAIGFLHIELGNYDISQKVLEEALATYMKHSPRNHAGIAKILLHLGHIYRHTGKNKKAEQLYWQSLIIYKKYLFDNKAGTAWVLGSLGSIYKEVGNYEESRKFLEEALENFSKDDVGYGRTLIHLGDVYINLGEYEKALEHLKKGFNVYEDTTSKDAVGYGWALAHLGDGYTYLGQYENAKNFLEQGVTIYKMNHLTEKNVGFAWALAHLGKVYASLGNYEKARNLLEQSLHGYEKGTNKDHIETARILITLGHTHLIENHLGQADHLFQQALEKFKRNKHPETYIALESLAELYQKKSIFEKSKENILHARNFKTNAISYLTQALFFVKNNFSANSPHIIRIQEKIKSLEQE